MSQQEDGTSERAAPDPAQRLVDHAAIDRLATGLLPALVQRVAASGLGELEVREGGWRVRLRMPAEAAARAASAAAEQRATVRREAETVAAEAIAAAATANGTRVAAGEPVDAPPDPVGQPDPPLFQASPPGGDAEAKDESGPALAVATSPAVGFFRPRANLAPGARVRAGESLGFIDVLGVPKDVPAPTVGTFRAFLVEPGEPVEFGQEILEIDTAEPAAHSAAAASMATPAAGAGPAGPTGPTGPTGPKGDA